MKKIIFILLFGFITVTAHGSVFVQGNLKVHLRINKSSSSSSGGDIGAITKENGDLLLKENGEVLLK